MGIVLGMKKRVFASLLWFYAGWFAGSSAAAFFGLGPAVGPILGTVAAVAVALAPQPPALPRLNVLRLAPHRRAARQVSSGDSAGR
jgi:hypothetical protein